MQFLVALVLVFLSFELAARDAGADSAGSEERVEALRGALVDRAMQAPVRVRSSAWVDESGQFRHVTRLYSDLRARALADLVDEQQGRPARSEGGVAKGVSAPSPSAVEPSPIAAVATESKATPPPAAASPSPELTCPQSAGSLKRFASIEVATRPHDGSHGHSGLLEIADRVRAALLQAARGSSVLRLRALDATPNNTYEYRLANDGLFDMPYRVEIEVHSSGVADRSLKPGEPVNMRGITLVLTVHERAGARNLFRRQYSALLPGQVPVVGRPGLPREFDAVISEFVNDWWQAAGEALRCEPIRVQGSPDSASTLTIPLGAGAGVRMGDRWLVTDAVRIPARVLELGALAGLQVGEVVAVGPNRATLRLESKSNQPVRPPVSERGVQWFANPM